MDAGMDPGFVVVGGADLDLAIPETLARNDHKRSEAATDIEGELAVDAGTPIPSWGGGGPPPCVVCDMSWVCDIVLLYATSPSGDVW